MEDFFSDSTISSFSRRQQCSSVWTCNKILLPRTILFYIISKISKPIFRNRLNRLVYVVLHVQFDKYGPCRILYFFLYVIPNQQLLHYLHYVIISIVYQIEYVTHLGWCIIIIIHKSIRFRVSVAVNRRGFGFWREWHCNTVKTLHHVSFHKCAT